jgi:hyperosmotically inducible protein
MGRALKTERPAFSLAANVLSGQPVCGLHLIALDTSESAHRSGAELGDRGMRYILCAFGLCAILGCGSTDRSNSTKTSATDRTPDAAQAPARDNTAVNTRDRSGDTKTPINQNENQKDVDRTAAIRRRVVDTKMSTLAHNVKIITQDGKVTLRGPVKSDEERSQIEAIAYEVAGRENVDSQLEIQP